MTNLRGLYHSWGMVAMPVEPPPPRQGEAGGCGHPQLAVVVEVEARCRVAGVHPDLAWGAGEVLPPAGAGLSPPVQGLPAALPAEPRFQ